MTNSGVAPYEINRLISDKKIVCASIIYLMDFIFTNCTPDYFTYTCQ